MKKITSLSPYVQSDCIYFQWYIKSAATMAGLKHAS